MFKTNITFNHESNKYTYTQSVTVRSKSSIVFKTQSGRKYGPNTSCKVTFRVMSIRRYIFFIIGDLSRCHISKIAEDENMSCLGDVLSEFRRCALKVKLQRQKRGLSPYREEKVVVALQKYD